MFNYIALQWVDYFIFGPWRDKTTINLPVSPALPDYAMLPTFGGTRVNAALILAIVAAVILYFFMNHTTSGYQIRVIGKCPRAAHYAGMGIGSTMMLVMLLSGGLSGLAGVAQVGGAGGRLVQNVAAGAGYTALIIARLSKNNPLMILLVSLIFGGLAQGSYSLQLAAVPWQVTKMLQGAILFCALGGELFITNKISIRILKKKSPVLSKEAAIS